MTWFLAPVTQVSDQALSPFILSIPKTSEQDSYEDGVDEGVIDETLYAEMVRQLLRSPSIAPEQRDTPSDSQKRTIEQCSDLPTQRRKK